MAVPKSSQPADRSAGGRGRAWITGLATSFAIFALVAGFLVVVAVVVVRGHLLDDRLYNDTLAGADVHERIYTEVLADPELAEIKERLIGELGIGGIDPASVRVLKTNALRWAVPPSILAQGTETFIGAVLAYLRGDTARIDGDIDLQPVLVELKDVAIREARAALATGGETIPTSLGEYRVAVRAFADTLADGRIPAAVPSAADSIQQSEVIDVVLEEVGTRTGIDLRTLIEGEVAAGNERDALITAATPLVADRVEIARAELRDALERGRDFDVISELAARADNSERRVVAHLDTVRDVASWFRSATLILGLVLMGGGGAVLLVLHRSNLTRAGYLLAFGLALAGGIALGGWFAVRHGVDSPLGAATRTDAGSWNLPAGMRGVLRDVEAGLANSLDDVVIRLALIPIVAGAVLGTALAVAPSLPRLRPVQRFAIAGGLAIVAGVVVLVVREATSHERVCNGHAELCDRPYDEVVYAATHNSMSVPGVVDVWPEHDGTIREQLDDGIRALLIDTHYWTAVVSPEQLTSIDPLLPRDLASRVLSQGGDRLGARDGTFLCHNHCVWGGMELTAGLEDIQSFLAENPDEVVTLIIQDGITPRDTAAAFANTRLDQHVYVNEKGAPWPTLGELIDRGRRLVVFAEEEGPPPAWYHPAFEYIQETPYEFSEPTEFSCAPNRGPASATLFLMNHWVQQIAPDRRDSVVVNAHDFIIERARQCEAERNQLPDFVAVNFYGIGDTVAAVDTLNGIGN